MENKPQILQVKTHEDARGFISFLEDREVPFSIKRVYYFFGNKVANVERGRHGHIRLEQGIVCMHGQFDVEARHRGVNYEFRLDDPSKLLYIPMMSWRTIRNMSDDSVGVVLASRWYEKNDYIFDYEEFLSLEKNTLRQAF